MPKCPTVVFFLCSALGQHNEVFVPTELHSSSLQFAAVNGKGIYASEGRASVVYLFAAANLIDIWN